MQTSPVEPLSIPLGVPCPRCALKIAQSQIVTVVYNGDNEMERETEKTFYLGKVATL